MDFTSSYPLIQRSVWSEYICLVQFFSIFSELTIFSASFEFIIRCLTFELVSSVFLIFDWLVGLFVFFEYFSFDTNYIKVCKRTGRFWCSSFEVLKVLVLFKKYFTLNFPIRNLLEHFCDKIYNFLISFKWVLKVI